MITPAPRAEPWAGRPGPDTSRSGWVCFAGADWWYHNRAHSDFQLMLRVARRQPVLVVNSITMRMPLPGRTTEPLRRIARKAASMAKLLRRPVPELPDFHVLTPVIVPLYGSPAGRRLNAALVRAQVSAAVRHLGMRDPWCLVTIPTAWEVVRDMPRRGLVLNRADLYSAFDEADGAYIRELEESLLRASDAVVYVSRALMEQEAPLSGGRATWLDHGVDLEHFRPRDDEPDDLRAIPRPRIGFFGAFDDYTVDVGLLQRVAREVPEAQLVLIGPSTFPMDPLTALPNVHWLGARPYAEIPRYGSGFDVALMPWLRSRWIRYCNPIKMKEYLALGLPVVTTDFPEVRAYDATLRIASDEDDFVRLVRQTLGDGGPGTPASRRAAVAGDSWDHRAEQLIELVERTCAAS